MAFFYNNNYYFDSLMLLNDVDFYKGTAYIHGMQHARGNFIIIMDADLSHHVSLCTLVQFYCNFIKFNN